MCKYAHKYVQIRAKQTLKITSKKAEAQKSVPCARGVKGTLNRACSNPSIIWTKVILACLKAQFHRKGEFDFKHYLP